MHFEWNFQSISNNLSPSTNKCCLLSKNPKLKQSYERAKELDQLADKYQSNQRLIEAIDMYKDLILSHDKELNDTMLKKIAERCIERMRFVGKLKAAIEIHKKLIERFPDEPSFQNDLAVTYLLGNR